MAADPLEHTHSDRSMPPASRRKTSPERLVGRVSSRATSPRLSPDRGAADSWPAVASIALYGLKTPLHLLDDLIDAEARGSLAWRVVLERRKELTNDGRSGDDDAGSVRHQPVIVGVGGDVGTLVRI